MPDMIAQLTTLSLYISKPQQDKSEISEYGHLLGVSI